MDYPFSRKYYAMLRTYEKLRVISTDNGPNIDNATAGDLSESFFSDCYHLKDWIKKDPNICQAAKDDVEGYISKSPVLRIAADYTNSLKHAGLDPNKKPRSGTHLDGVNTHLKIDLTPRGFVTSAQVEIIFGGKRYDAFRLASDCVHDWKIFFKKHSIVTGEP